MKRLFFCFLMTAMAVLTISSCKEPLAKRFDALVNQVEKNWDTYTEADWEKTNAQFEKLMDEFDKNKDSYSKEELKQIQLDVFKYASLVTKAGIKAVSNTIQNVADEVPSVINEVKDILKDAGVPVPDKDKDKDKE